MAFIKTTNRLEVIEALLNESLRDKTIYCNNCNADYDIRFFPCCEDPQIGNNADHLRAVVIENQYRRENLHKETGATRDGSMRIAFSLPPRIYGFISNYFQMYHEKFPKDNKELHALMRRFKKLTVPSKV